MHSFETVAMLEALLFASGEPQSAVQLAEALGMPLWELEAALEKYRESLETPLRGITLRFVAGGWQLVTKPALAEMIAQIAPKRQHKLSKPTVETLAIIAYRQPITRAEVEAIRGVKVDSVLYSLLEKGLIVPVGRKETVGRPILYATGEHFLEYFGLKSLDELPDVGRLEL